MHLLWEEIRAAVPLIYQGNPYLWSVIWFSVQVTLVATTVAALLGLPLALWIGLGRSRGRAVLQWLANAGVAMPPVLAGLALFMLMVPEGPLGSLHLLLTRRSIFIAQTVLAVPYVVALGAAAIQGLRPGVLAQARALGAGRLQVAVLALREARRGVIAAIIAAAGITLAEVGAIVVVGGNVYGYDQTLASSILFNANAAHYAAALASGIVLIGLILIIMGGLSFFQERRGAAATR